jgi:rhomboid family GlyGly-CTERM serine protease
VALRLRLRALADRLAWQALALLLGAGALAASLAPPGLLDWQPQRVWDQPWRAFSAAFVHWSALHLSLNLIGTLVVAAWGWAARVPAAAALAWAAAWPLTHLALLLEPALQSYGGLSGVLHAGAAVVAVWLLRRARGPRRWIGAAVLLGLVVKVVAEAPWQAPVQAVAGLDFPVAAAAHAGGLLAGALLGALAAACSGGSARPPAVDSRRTHPNPKETPR